MYISVREAAAKWGVTPRQVQRLLADNRIPGAKKIGRAWVIPADAQKPGDPRFEHDYSENSLAAEFSRILDQSILPMPSGKPDAILDTVSEPRLRLQFEAELAYLRGDFARVCDCYRKTEGDAAARLRAAPVTIAAAISAGDYPLFLELESALKDVANAEPGGSLYAFAELCLSTGYTGAMAPDMIPDWLKNGDFSALHPKARPDAAYKRAKYFQCLGQYESMLLTAQTALSFCATEHGISFQDIYFRVACALACVGLERTTQAESWLSEALSISLSHGFVTPFAESATAFGGLLEKLLKSEYPAYFEAVMKQWERTFTNWLSFHNSFTRDNITLILSLREYELAQLAARGLPDKEIGQRFNLAAGTVKNKVDEICEKLFLSGRNRRKELTKYVL